MSFLRKLRKNKFVVLAICVIIISVIYTIVQNAIDNHELKTNEDIAQEERIDEDETRIEKNAIDFGTELDSENEEVDDIENIENVVRTDGKENSGNKIGATESSAEKIYVYITGEVNVPGVVILDKGSRIVDAINSAGGTTARANVTKVNLVYVLDDGMKINIPNDNDLKNNPNFEYITLNSGDGGKNDYSDVSGSANSNTGVNSGSGKEYSVVNINTATQTELETLPGIGPSLALNIINYRKENGRFSSIDEIKSVSGIGESKFEKIKRYITV